MSPKSILITGCSAGGIGSAIALELATRHPDNHVFATARNILKIADDLSNLPNVTVLQLDVCSASSVTKAVKAVEASRYGLHVLVNNAGAGYAMPILDMDIERAKKIYDVNIWGPVRTIQAFASLLIASRGRIVNLSSVGGLVNTPWIGTSSFLVI